MEKQRAIEMNNSIQVWQIPLQVSDEIVQSYERCLAVDERSRADRFRFPDDRRRFVVARGTLRHLLSHQLNCTPQAIAFCYGQYGKPQVEPTGSEGQTTAQSTPGNCDFHFNISHSGELALCALGQDHRVGIDVEKMKEIQRLDSMMSRCLLPNEQALVKASQRPLQAFLKYWTCKEAYLKAIGMGLRQSMTTVEVEMSPPRLVQVPDSCSEGWQLHLIEVPEGYAGALVVEGNSLIEVKNWEHLPG
ncbi:MAG: 4'-phosphopantetheinyl transferase superfamily protein [Cyanobacteria bacterium J06560_2]